MTESPTSDDNKGNPVKQYEPYFWESTGQLKPV